MPQLHGKVINICMMTVTFGIFGNLLFIQPQFCLRLNHPKLPQTNQVNQTSKNNDVEVNT